MPSRRPLIFISYAREDSRVADGLSEVIDDGFFGIFDVFVASDGSSIRPGDNWSGEIEVALRRADLVLVLLSAASLERRWVYFEAGGAHFLGKRVIPICCGGLPITRIGSPLDGLQAIDPSVKENLTQLFREIAAVAEMRKLPPVPLTRLASVLSHTDIRESHKERKSPDLVAEPIEWSGGAIRRRPVLVFFVVDASGSMVGDKIERINEGLTQFTAHLRAAQDVSFSFLVSIISFGSGARQEMPPTPVEEIEVHAPIAAAGTTDLGAAFSLLARVVEDPGTIPRRSLAPVVIVFTDGRPTDDWRAGLARFTSTPWGKLSTRIAVAIGHDADRDVLQIVSTDGAVLSVNDPAALTAFFRWSSTAVATAEVDADSESDRFTLPPPPVTGMTDDGDAW